jgi:hypothetical protein
VTGASIEHQQQRPCLSRLLLCRPGSHQVGAAASTGRRPEAEAEISRPGGVERFEEVIVSTLPQRVSDWLHHDVPARVERLGVRVTVVTARQAERAVWEDMRQFGGP